MITNVSLTTIYCLDQTAAKEFYVDKLGFEPRTDAEMWPGARWVTVGHPDHPELEITLMLPGPPLSDEAAGSSATSSARGRWAASPSRSTTAGPCSALHQ